MPCKTGMKQHSTSLWHATESTPKFDALTGEQTADVVIIGAGITGPTAAALLRERGRSVIVLEKDTVAGGETGNTTAHITEAVDARYHYLKRKYSPEDAKLVADASRASIAKIAELIERHVIDCRFRRVPGYLYTEKRKYVAELKTEARAAQEAGVDATFTETVPLPFLTRGAALFANQAQFHPLEYLSGLASKLDCPIFEHTRVTDVKNGDPCVVETEHGRVTAKAVLMATNVPIAGYTHIHTLAAPYRTYAIAFESNGEHPEGLFWDTADPYHYTRWQDTDEGTFMIVGGEDHRVGEEEDTEGCFQRLLDYTREHFGEVRERYRWSGQVIEPHGGLPLIGGKENVYISTGYAGQGMTFGTVGAMIVADLITGAESPWAKVFDLDRVRPHMTAREFLTENLHFPAHLAKDRLTSFDVEGKSLDEVQNGEGKIVKVEGKKIAAFRDDSGALHCLSPVCTHMGCDVAFNDAEKTWDCPCHGSRFTTEGEVLNGPAREPLGKIDPGA
jgi:glycine/D-amino acid oxidase-like deaminating enzyme/nitrite reductase/ring-hydroxylating ferredoxin subunit